MNDQTKELEHFKRVSTVLQLHAQQLGVSTTALWKFLVENELLAVYHERHKEQVEV